MSERPPVHLLLQPDLSEAYKKQLLRSMEKDRHSMDAPAARIFDQTKAAMRRRLDARNNHADQ